MFIKAPRGEPLLLGTATTAQYVRFKQGPNSQERDVSISLIVQPHQLGVLEKLRAGGDFVLKLTLTGIGGDENPDHTTEFDAIWSIPVDKSNWVKQLNAAGATDTLLIEFPLPLFDDDTPACHAANELRRAQIHFLQGR